MTIQQKDREITNQKILSFTLCIMLFFSPIIQFVNIFLIFLFWIQISVDSLILYGFQLIMTVISLGIVIKRMKLSTMLLPLFFLLSFVISAAFHPETRQYMFTSWGDFVGNKVYWMFIYALPAFVIIRRIWDYDRLFRYMLAFSIPSMLCSLGVLILYLIKDDQPGYMSFSYDLLPAVVVLLFGFFTKRKALYLIGSIVGFVIMFFCGARGPMLCIFVAIVMYIVFMTEKNSSKILIVMISAIGLVLLFVFWDPIFQVLCNVSESLGLSSRMLEKIADGSLVDDSGRSTVRSELLPHLSILGHGLYGDRVLANGRYAHSIFLEILVEYGLFFGPVILLFLVFLLVTGLFTKDRGKRLLFIFFFSAGFVRLLISGSYLSKEPAFYAMIGICFSALFKDDVKPKQSNDKLFVRSLRLRKNNNAS